MDLPAYIEDTNRAGSPEQVFDLFRGAVNPFGYDKVAFAAVTPAAQTAVASLLPRPALVVSCPQDWVEHYQARRYQDIDPCLLQAPMRLRPYTWAELAAGGGLSGRQRTLFCEARDAGLHDGLCIPVHGPAGESYVVSLSGAATAADTAAHLGTLQLLATQLQVAYTSLARNGMVEPIVHLSDRERECLTWTARGKSAWSISQILCLSEHTVQFHLKGAMRKIGAGNRVQAVVTAIRMGLIAP
ncbi:MAG TPA: LuxR family transcriptional regulator [Rhodospirillales bacterium]|nr:LuxR family transcriptional regulator [Rhodospirillales bacterium]